MAVDRNAGRAGPPRLGPLAAAAWVEVILRYWRDVHERAPLVPARPLTIVDLAPLGETLHLVLRALIECAARSLGFAPTLRYLACVPDGVVPPAWQRVPELRARLDDGSLVVVPEANWDRWSGMHAGAGQPLVVLAHGAWGHLAQRLFAIHYGRWLEATTTGARAEGDACEEERWGSAELPPCGPQVRRVMEGYRSRLNSAPVSWPEGAMRRIERIARVGAGGCLVLAMDEGFVSERQFRLCGFERVSSAGRALPVNFQLLEAQWQQLGALTWQLGLPHDRAIQVAVIGAPKGAQTVPAEVIAPLRSGAFADADAMVRLAGSAVRQGDDAQMLALLRHSLHDPAVFAAACPALHERMLARPGCDRAGWSAALRRVAANHLPMADGPPLHDSLARAAMRVADWGLARRVLEGGLHVHGENLRDLLLLASCEAGTGRLREAVACATRALALDASDARAMALVSRLLAKLERWGGDWRRAIRHPELPLVLEPLEQDHAEALLVQYRDPQIAVMTGLPALADLDAARRWIGEQLETKDRCDYAVMHADAGLVGYVGLHVSGDTGLLCFWTGIDHQGQGLAAEAARLLCTFARDRGVEWIFGEAFSDNRRSVRAMERAGFVSLDLRARADGEDREILCFELLQAERQAAMDALLACLRQFDRDIELAPGTTSPMASESIA